MIQKSLPPWQRRLHEAVGSLEELAELLELPRESLAGAHRASDFPLRVPRSFVARMERGNPADPLLLQVLPGAEEGAELLGKGSNSGLAPWPLDPLEEDRFQGPKGLIHKYHGRALLIVVGACGIHCRYCFRRHFPYSEASLGRRDQEDAVAYLAKDSSIREVIFSGGDPLSARDERLADLAQALAEVPHLKRLRIHSRMPVVLPERVDDALLTWLTNTRLRPVMVVHANHAQEIDGEVAAAFRRLQSAGVPVLNQAVLLRGVNDSVEALRDLSEALFAAGVLPYYLHQLDRVRGARHFEVPEDRARRLVAKLAATTSGYLVPRLVREIPGAAAKVPLDLESHLLPEVGPRPVPATGC